MSARTREGHLEMKALVLLLALAAPLVLAAEESVRLDSAPIDPRDVASLQAGARTFVNYCLNCHSAGMMRYHKLLDLGLTEQQVKENLLFTADKIGELMTVAMTKQDAKEWFGTAPPDRSAIARPDRRRHPGPRSGHLHGRDGRAQSARAQAGGLRGDARSARSARAHVPPLQGVLERRALKGNPPKGAGRSAPPRLFHLHFGPISATR